MTNNSINPQPVDFAELHAADALTRAWDAWLVDEDLDESQAAAGSLDPDLTRLAFSLHDRDSTPRAHRTFRHSLKRDLLHAYDAIQIGGISPMAAISGISVPAPDPIDLHERKRRRRFSLLSSSRRWWPALEFAAAMILIAGLLSVTFGNARIAKLFRDEAEPTSIAAFGAQPTEPPATETPVAEPTLQSPVAGTNSTADRAPEAAVAVAGEAGSVRSTGTPLWTTRYDSSHLVKFTAATDSTLFLVGNYADGSTQIIAIDTETHSERWRADLPDGFANQPVVYGDTIYVVGETGYVMGWNEFSQEPVLSADTNGRETHAAPLIFNDTLYFVSSNSSPWPQLAFANGYIFLVGKSTDSIVAINLATSEVTIDHPLLDPGSEEIANAVWKIEPKTGDVIDWQQSQDGAITEIWAASDDAIVTSRFGANGGPSSLTVWSTADLSPTSIDFESGSSVHLFPTGSRYFGVYAQDLDIQLYSIQAIEGGFDAVPAPLISRTGAENVAAFSVDGTIFFLEGSTITVVSKSLETAIEVPQLAEDDGSVVSLTASTNEIFIVSSLGTINAFDRSGRSIGPGSGAGGSNANSIAAPLESVVTPDPTWQQNINELVGFDFQTEAVVATDEVLIVVGVPFDIVPHLVALDAIDGSLLWNVDLPGGYVGVPIEFDNVVYVLAPDGELYGFDVLSGELVFDVVTENRVFGASPFIIQDGFAYIASSTTETAPSVIWSQGYLIVVGGSFDIVTTVDLNRQTITDSRMIQPDALEEITNTLWQIDPASGEVADQWHDETLSGTIQHAVTLPDGTVQLTVSEPESGVSVVTIVETFDMSVIDQYDAVDPMVNGPNTVGSTAVFGVASGGGAGSNAFSNGDFGGSTAIVGSGVAAGGSQLPLPSSSVSVASVGEITVSVSGGWLSVQLAPDQAARSYSIPELESSATTQVTIAGDAIYLTGDAGTILRYDLKDLITQ